MTQRPAFPFNPFRRGNYIPFRSPPAIHNLPINLLRQSNYPRRPGLVREAITQYDERMAGAPKPMILPQRMAFQAWKTTPGQVQRTWDSSAQSFVALNRQFVHGVPSRVVRYMAEPPRNEIVMAAVSRGANHMPQPPLSPHPVIARPVRANDGTSRTAGRYSAPPQAHEEQWLALYGVRAHIKRLRRTAALAGARAAAMRARSVR